MVPRGVHQAINDHVHARFSTVRDPHPRATRLYTDRLQSVLDAYTGRPIDVRVREMVGPLPADDLTHGIYPYPARLIRHIPRLLLGSRQVAGNANFVVDPFCGSGTVLLEAQQAGLASYGFDQNPIAQLVSRVKTTPRSERELRSALDQLIYRAKRTRRRAPCPGWLNRWYSQEAKSALERLVAARGEIASPETEDFLDLTVALAARRFSLADPRIPVPVLAKSPRAHRRVEIWDEVDSLATRLIRRIGSLPAQLPQTNVLCVDARDPVAWNSIPDQPNGLLFTSPPYGASQKYVRSTSLEAGWLGYSSETGTADLERTSIGREHIRNSDRTPRVVSDLRSSLRADLATIGELSPSRAKIYGHYFCDMHDVIRNAAMKSSIQTAVLIMGDNFVAGMKLETSRHIRNMMLDFDFEEVILLRDRIAGRTLLTRRRGNSIPTECESIAVFRRG